MEVFFDKYLETFRKGSLIEQFREVNRAYKIQYVGQTFQLNYSLSNLS